MSAAHHLGPGRAGVRAAAFRVRGVGLLSSTALVSAAVAFAVNLITARAIGPEGRGSVALVLQIAYISAPLAGLGYPQALLRNASTVGRASAIGGGRLGVIVVIALLSPIAVWLYGTWYFLFGFVALVTVAFQVQRSLAIVSGSFKGYFVSYSAYQLSILFGSLALWGAGASAWQLWVAVYAFPGAAVLLRSFKLAEVTANPLIIIRSNWAFIWAAVSQLVLLRSERLIMGAVLGNGPLGVYVVVATATEPLYWIAQSVADSRSATSYQAASRSSIVRRIFRDFIGYALVAAAGGIALFFLLVPVFGDGYSGGRQLVLPLVVSVVLLAMYRQAAGVALVRSGTRALGITESLLSLFALLAYSVAIVSFGVLGGAWACVVVYGVAFVVLITVGLLGKHPLPGEGPSQSP